MIDRIRAGRTDLVRDYLAAGHGADATDGAGVPLIRWCAYYGDVSAVRYLLEAGERLEALGHNFDLNGAAFHGHWQYCEFLVEAGADPNDRLQDAGETPLHAAFSRVGGPRQDRVVAVLLAAGADPNIATVPGAPTGCFMRDARTKGETALHRAAAFSSAECVGALIAAGARLDAKDAGEETPLGWASWHLRPAAILRLLCHGPFTINPAARWTGDHGQGAGGMEVALVGEPRPADPGDIRTTKLGQ